MKHLRIHHVSPGALKVTTGIRGQRERILLCFTGTAQGDPKAGITFFEFICGAFSYDTKANTNKGEVVNYMNSVARRQPTLFSPDMDGKDWDIVMNAVAQEGQTAEGVQDELARHFTFEVILQPTNKTSIRE